jgi:hypothetical protein
VRFLIDQNIPASVGRALDERGHSITHVRDILRPDSPDQLIAFLAIQEGFVILTHDRDFRNINELAPHGYRRRFHRADRIILGPTSTRAVPRLLAVLDLIEFMYEWTRTRHAQFRVDITEISVRIVDQAAPLRPP